MTNPTETTTYETVPSGSLKAGDVVRLGDHTIARLHEAPRAPHMGFYARATVIHFRGEEEFDGGTFTANLGLETERRV